MRLWNLKPADPLVLTLAADARATASDYCDDQIWELALGGGDPPALALQTTYGLRARSQRLFPRFVVQSQSLTDPAAFSRPPSLARLYPNYLRLGFSPIPGIDVEAEYWVPESNAAAGRLTLVNTSEQPLAFRLDWVAQLSPASSPTESRRMAPSELENAPVLCGQTGELSPVVFMTGGAQPISSPYPALSLEIELSPGGIRQLTWCHAGLGDCQDSFALVRSTVARPWEAEISRLELLNAAQVEVYTGEADWDVAFACSQNLAYGLFVGPGPQLPHPSFVLTRQPDHGYSLRGDGSDYDHLWNGQPALEAYYLSTMLLPGGAALVQDILRNYLAVQEPDGSIDWKPGLAGQRSRLLATPLLATLALRLYQHSLDKAFLDDIFQPLLDFLHAWFTPAHDRDNDGVPEWDHPMHSGFEDHPLFSYWHDWSQGVDITTAESPSLCSFLYRECLSLVKIAEILARKEPIPALQSIADHLLTVLETAWDEQAGSYTYWDRDSHQSPVSQFLGKRRGPGMIEIERDLDQPARVLLRVHVAGESTVRPRLVIHGFNASGQHRIEQVGDERFRWFLGNGSLTGERVYARLEQVEITGIGPQDEVELTTAGYLCQDQTTLLPLWAGIPDDARAALLVERSVTDRTRFWQPGGIPACPITGAYPQEEAGSSTAETTSPADVACQGVHMAWNQLVGEGLLAYGYQAEAAELVSRLMNSIIQNLKPNGAFRRYYHAVTGQGSGERNILNGLAPLGLFLEALGVRLISSRQVFLWGFNPFPWPITVKYRGLTVLRQRDKSTVIFPDGQTVEIAGGEGRLVSLDKD